MATNEDGWVATTHDWSLSVDVAHLDFIRAHQDRYCPVERCICFWIGSQNSPPPLAIETCTCHRNFGGKCDF